jgi:transcriptional regulator with XRE-family HTH domain
MLIENLSSQQAGAESAHTASIREQMLEAFKSSKDARHSFIQESIATRLTAQIHAIRSEQGWSPQEFADKLGKKLSWVYRLEDPNVPPPTISTLLGVAEALDIGLDVCFRRFSELLDDATNLTPESFQVPSFDSELKSGAFKSLRIRTRRPRRTGLFVVTKPGTKRKGLALADNNYASAGSRALSAHS